MEREAKRTLSLLGNKFFSVAFTWLLEQRFHDTLCGTKVLFKRDYEKIAANRDDVGDFDPFGDFDLIFGASKRNLQIVEVPCAAANGPAARPTSAGFATDGCRCGRARLRW